jgi:tetratricopeptide (TPR) repeat protein
VYNNLGLIYKNIGKIPKALFFNEMGIKLAENNPDYAQTFVFLLHINGDLLIRQSKFKEADSVLHKAIVVAEKLNFVGGLTPSYELLGEMSTKQGNKEAALNNYKKGYESAVASGSIDLVQKIANKLQIIYKDLGNTDSAFKYLNISIDTQKKIKIEEAKEELVNKENKRKFEEWQKESDRQHVRSSLLYWIIASVSLLIAIVVFVFYLKKRKQHKLMLLEKIEKDLAFQHLELEKTLLESTLENKEKQLTSDILYQIQKNEMIEDVVKKLLNQTKQSTEVNKEIIHEAINNLSQTQESNVWTEFETRFKKVHVDFYDNLQVKYPELSRNDRRLCAFLRLNMTTKEISAISGQSLKSIDVARSRLRKKLGIANAETGLVEFMSTI